jgi:hypothetical protein
MAQVREHTESTRSQYALAGKAVTLVTRVCSGDVEAIFGIEITRLARSNADVARLAEFARITGTLLIDPRQRLRPRRCERPRAAGLQGHHGRGLMPSSA